MNKKITALYERSNSNDESENNSIINQKRMLQEYAEQNGYNNIVHFSDSNISGRCFDRSGLAALLKEVDNGNVDTVIVKDISRIGRDSLKVIQYIEKMRKKGVRLISVKDGVDGLNDSNCFTFIQENC